MMWLRE